MPYIPRHLKDHITRISSELRENARTPSRPTAAEYAPHVAALVELGYTDDEINSAFGWEQTKRYLRKIKQEGKMDGTGLVRIEREPVPFDRLTSEYRAMLEWTPEAFIAFYNRFNYQRLPEHCVEWVHEAFENDLLMLNVPPRHNKSTLFSIWWPIWNIVRDRDCQVMILSLTDTLSARWVGYVAALLSYGDIPQTFGRFKPEKQDGEMPWRPSKGELMVMGRSRKGTSGGAMQFSVLSRGAGSQIFGFEADIIVVDDVTDKKIAVSDTMRPIHQEWLHEQVFSRLQPDGRALIVGQRVHLADIYGHLKEQLWDTGPKKGEPVWAVIEHPAVLRWPEKEDFSDAVVLWADVWPYERLMKSYALVGGKSAFFTMYQQDPMSGGSTLVQEAWLEGCRDYDRPVGRGFRLEKGAEGYLPVVRVASLDPSPTMYNGLVVADVVPSRDQFFAVVLDAKSFKADWSSIRSEIDACIENYRPTYFIFEKNIAQYWAKGDPFIEELRKKVRVMEHTTSSNNKFDIEAGLESLAFDFETGHIRLPYDGAEAKSVSGLLEREARNWTREGRLRDDVLMAMWFIKFNWRRLSAVHNLPTHFLKQGTQKPYAYIRRAKNRQKKPSRFDINRMRIGE